MVKFADNRKSKGSAGRGRWRGGHMQRYGGFQHGGYGYGVPYQPHYFPNPMQPGAIHCLTSCALSPHLTHLTSPTYSPDLLTSPAHLSQVTHPISHPLTQSFSQSFSRPGGGAGGATLLLTRRFGRGGTRSGGSSLMQLKRKSMPLASFCIGLSNIASTQTTNCLPWKIQRIL